MTKIFLAAIILLCISKVFAQDDIALLSNSEDVTVLTLEECMVLAIDNNLNLKRSENSLHLARSNKKQSVLNFLPDLNGSASYNINQGANFDNNSGNFVTTTFTSASPRISSNLLLFNAFSNHHLLNRRDHELSSALYSVKASEILIRATVLNLYLSVILDKENIRNSEQRLTLLTTQLDRENKRESVGVGNLETVFNFRSQVANERLNLVNLKNNLMTDLLTLQQAVRSDNSFFDIADIDVFDEIELSTVEPFDVVLEEVLNYSYNVKMSEETRLAAIDFLKQTRSSRYPSVSLYGELGTRYSNQNVGEFYSQLQNFDYQQAGVFVSIPIFNQYKTQNNIDRAKVAMLNAELDNKQAIQDVTNSVQSDYLDLVAAVSSFQTANENFNAQEGTFDFMKKRFETGNTDFYTYLESLNNKNSAQLQLINAKYSIVFRKKILELYRGS